MLRWASRQGDAVDSVLGNHDLHLLAQREGILGARPRDTLAPVLRAPDADELCDWLAVRPLALRVRGNVLVHAGIHPAWTLAEAERRAAAAGSALRRRRRAFLQALYAVRGETAPAGAAGQDDETVAAAAADASVLTRIRVVDRGGEPDYGFDGPPEGMPPDRVPWFDRARVPAGQTVVFGHWAALGVTASPGGAGQVIGLDSGCVWGGFLTALRLDDGAFALERAARAESLQP